MGERRFRRSSRPILVGLQLAERPSGNATMASLLDAPVVEDLEPQLRSEGRFTKTIVGDARTFDLEDASVDLIVTSPPYWRKRDYRVPGQIGQEDSPDKYAAEMKVALERWRSVLRPTGSVFLNIGDTYDKKSLAGIPFLIERAAYDAGYSVRNRIVWIKKGGVPTPAKDRLVNRHEYVLHLAPNGYFYDLHGYANDADLEHQGANPGDVWSVPARLLKGNHLAPFPPEIARRAILLACPKWVCAKCGKPIERNLVPTMELNEARPQARRALALFKEKHLTPAHFNAIRATGISDAGKAQLTQTGTGKNTLEVQRLAREAKEALGGYFREFTFAKRKHMGWRGCECKAGVVPGVVLDPFMGTGTTLGVAKELGRSAIGVDLVDHIGQS